MNNKEKELLENFTKKMVKGTSLEKPSKNFSKSVMNAINKLESQKEISAYQPLISKKGWFLIVSSLVASIILLLKTTPIERPEFLSKIDTSAISNALSFDMSFSFTASNVTVYGFVFLAIMAIIQFGYIRNYYNN